MTGSDWSTRYARSLGVFLNGHAISEPGPRGEVVVDDNFLLLVNAHSEPVTFRLPGTRFAARWEVVISSAVPPGGAEGEPVAPVTAVPAAEGGQVSASGGLEVPGHAMVVLRGAGPAGRTAPAGED